MGVAPEQAPPELEYERVNFAVAIGEPSTAILDYAQAQSIDSSTIPSRSQRGIGHFLLGSVAKRVIRYTNLSSGCTLAKEHDSHIKSA